MKEKLYKMYFTYRHEVDLPEQFVCICQPSQVSKIDEHYSELFGQIIDPSRTDAKGEDIPIEKRTSDPILQGWESFEGIPILEDIKTGERFYYETSIEMGYQLVPMKEGE